MQLPVLPLARTVHSIWCTHCLHIQITVIHQGILAMEAVVS